MTDRDAALLALRPSIDLGPDAPPPDTLDVPARLLHATLRPVLKLQNETLLTLVARAVAARTKSFPGFAPPDRVRHLDALVRRDVTLQRVLLGVVFGMLTSGELADWMDRDQEMRRRTVALLAERVTSQSDHVARLVVETLAA